MTTKLSTTTITTDEPDVPVLGQSLGRQEMSVDAQREGLVSLHGVRRTESSTVVYWSAGWTPDTVSGDRADLTDTFGGSGSTIGFKRGEGGEPTSDVAVVDTESQRVYTPVFDEEGTCFCSDFLKALPGGSNGVAPPAGKAYVMHASLPPLPDGVSTVSVKVAGKVFTDVPVENGVMTPEIEGREPILVGEGWPSLDVSAVDDVDDLEQFVYPLSKNSGVLKSAVSSRSESDKTSIDISADVLFDVDKATLTSKAKKEIRTAAREIKEANPSGTITITGHTDSDGADDHNQDLSERRAKAVTAEISSQLPDGVKVKTAGKGETEPIASNDSDAGKAKNRRVTITVPGGTS